RHSRSRPERASTAYKNTTKPRAPASKEPPPAENANYCLVYYLLPLLLVADNGRCPLTPRTANCRCRLPTLPGHVRPYKKAGILRYVLSPSMFRARHRTSQPPGAHTRNTSAQIDTPAAEKAIQTPYKPPADREPKISSRYRHFATESP